MAVDLYLGKYRKEAEEVEEEEEEAKKKLSISCILIVSKTFIVGMRLQIVFL